MSTKTKSTASAGSKTTTPTEQAPEHAKDFAAAASGLTLGEVADSRGQRPGFAELFGTPRETLTTKLRFAKGDECIGNTAHRLGALVKHGVAISKTKGGYRIATASKHDSCGSTQPAVNVTLATDNLGDALDFAEALYEGYSNASLESTRIGLDFQREQAAIAADSQRSEFAGIAQAVMPMLANMFGGKGEGLAVTLPDELKDTLRDKLGIKLPDSLDELNDPAGDDASDEGVAE